MTNETAITRADGAADLAQQIQLMAEKGMDPDTLKKYMDICDKAADRRASVEFNDAMKAVQEAAPVIVRDAQNNHTNSKYAKLETVRKGLKPVYLEHGFSISFSEEDCPKGENWVRVVALVRHDGGHSERFHRDGPIDDKGPKGQSVKSQLHGCQSTASYLERQLLCSIFGITVADQDDDGNGGRDPTPITEEQAIVIGEMFEGFPDDLQDSERDRLLKWVGVESIAEIPASWHDRVAKAVRGALSKRGRA